MYKDYRYINAGENEFYRWGKKAISMVEEYMNPKNGHYSIPADGGKYWTFGTSTGKYGEFAKYGNTFFSVNRGGFIYAKEGTEKADAFVSMLKKLVDDMKEKHSSMSVDDQIED